MPVWYNYLPYEGDCPYFPDYDKLSSTSNKTLLNLDLAYSCREVTKIDAAYQAWNKGFILQDPTIKLNTEGIKPTISDNYRFVRKYFHPFWSWYILSLRILTLHNPIKEIAAFIKNLRVRRIDLYEKVYPHEHSFQQFESRLLKSAPKVSVIIPTLNRYHYLRDALNDLEKQYYKNFEVIVVDQSEPFQPEFYEQFHLDLKLIRQEEKALWLARNTAIKLSGAEYLLLFDDDSRVAPDWISQHLKCLDYFNAEISSGVSISAVGAKIPENYSFFRWGDQVDTGNVMIHRRVFEKVGLFDRQFEKQRQGDGEFGLRAYLAGFKNVSNPYAKRLHLKVGEGGLRQMGSWDGFRPKSWLAPRPVPSVLYLTRKYFGNKAAIHSLLTGVPPSLIPYRFKRQPILLLFGSLLVFPFFPFVCWQVFKSWRIADKMLKEGAKIEYLQQHEHNAQNP
ncbi:MAG: glycosyltransferase family 2 protein [Thermaurantimonas sp.]